MLGPARPRHYWCAWAVDFLPLQALEGFDLAAGAVQGRRRAHYPLGQPVSWLSAVSRFPSPNSSASRSVFFANPRYRTLV